MNTKTYPQKPIDTIRCTPPVNMNVQEGAIYLGISPRKLRDEIYRKNIKSVKIGSRTILRKADLDAYLEKSVVK